MATPMGYNRDQVREIVNGSPNFFLYHHTPVRNLAAICADKNIYSLATLWGLHPTKRQTLTGNSARVSAEIGFIDYIFLSKINRVARNLPTIFGQLCFRIQPEILIDKESFVYPFNTGFNWSEPYTQKLKKSDSTTLERCIQSQFLTDEFLVRRKVSLEYVDAVYCFDNDHPLVQKTLDQSGWNIEIYNMGQTASGEQVRGIKKVIEPNFDIKICIGGGEKNITRDRLHMNPDIKSNIVYHDRQSNCFSEYTLVGSKLFDQFNQTCEIGEVVSSQATGTAG
jgi:hypothetical protein